jgi:DivIVA domain-containing protein
VTPDGLRDVTLPVVVRGYRMADVDDILERAARELEHARVVAQQRAEEPGVEPSGSSAVIDG